MSEYQTGDVTLSVTGAVRVYVNNKYARGYFFTQEDDTAITFVPRSGAYYDRGGLSTSPNETIVCTIADIARVIRETHGKEVR